MPNFTTEPSMLRTVRFWLIAVVVTIIATYLLTVRYVDSQLAQRNDNNIINDCHKVWSTRGLVTDVDNRLNDANSIASIQLAFAQGAKGVEVDVYFDLAMDRFIVSHDRPYNLKNGALLTLETLFNTLQHQGYIWLDFKKMTRLDKAGVQQAVTRLQAITADSDMAQRIYVESEHPINLAYFHRAGFQSLFDTQPLPKSFIGTELIHNLYKIIFFFGEYSVMGIDYGEIDDPVYNDISERVLQNVPMFVYHVPDNQALITRLAQQDNVRVILNANETVAGFGVSACRELQ